MPFRYDPTKTVQLFLHCKPFLLNHNLPILFDSVESLGNY